MVSHYSSGLILESICRKSLVPRAGVLLPGQVGTRLGRKPLMGFGLLVVVVERKNAYNPGGSEVTSEKTPSMSFKHPLTDVEFTEFLNIN